MSNGEKNIATLTEMYHNLGPGVEGFMAACRKAMTDDAIWCNSGYPAMNGLYELEKSMRMFVATMDFNYNPILEWRNMWALDNKVFFERKGSFSNVAGETIIAFDVLGVYEFTDDGKIFMARDYYDNSAAYQMIADKVGAELISMLQSQCVNPLSPDFDSDARPYSQMRF